MKCHRDKYFEQKGVWTGAMERYQQQVLNDLLAILPGDVESILDVGCGDGSLTNAFPETVMVVGMDNSEEALSQVKKEKIKGDITKGIPHPDKSFDLVMMNDVAEHLSVSERSFAFNEI